MYKTHKTRRTLTILGVKDADDFARPLIQIIMPLLLHPFDAASFKVQRRFEPEILGVFPEDQYIEVAAPYDLTRYGVATFIDHVLSPSGDMDRRRLDVQPVFADSEAPVGPLKKVYRR